MQLLDFLLVGDGNCAEVQFRFLGIFSIAEMSIIAFAGLFTVCLYTAFRQQLAD